MRVMLVDDSKTMRNIQRNILNQLGYDDIEEAADGQEALARIPSFRPGLVLVDGSMPNMDGITFVRALRAAGDMTPVIMVTTESEKARVVEAIEAGVNHYLVKPFTPEALEQHIRETLERIRAA